MKTPSETGLRMSVAYATSINDRCCSVCRNSVREDNLYLVMDFTDLLFEMIFCRKCLEEPMFVLFAEGRDASA